MRHRAKVEIKHGKQRRVRLSIEFTTTNKKRDEDLRDLMEALNKPFAAKNIWDFWLVKRH